MSTATQEAAGIDRFHWTVDIFYRALDARVFDHPEQLELIHGEIVKKLGQNAAHATLVSLVARLVRRLLEPQYTIRDEKPLRIAFDGEPVPDIQALRGNDLDYIARQPGPEDVALLIEVSNSSLEYDLGAKAALYAQAGIADYWVIDMNNRRVLVHRDPIQTSGRREYSSVTEHREGQTIAPLCVTNVTIFVTDLLLPSSD